jgi:hypothetical protein
MEIPVPRWQEWVLYSQKGTDRNDPKKVTQFGRAGVAGDSTGLYRSNLRNTPIPGITSIRVSNKGDLGTLRRATLAIKCYHEADLHELEMMYMVPGVSILLEWGWYSEVKSQQPIFLGDLEDNGRLNNITKIQEELLKKTLDIDSLLVQHNHEGSLETSAGLYDGLIGVVTKFNWSNASDGSYDIQIDIIAPNSLTLGVPTETYKLGGNIIDPEDGKSTPVTDVDVIYYKINTKSSRIEGDASKQAVQQNENISRNAVSTIDEFSDSLMFEEASMLSLETSALKNSFGFVEFYEEDGELKAKIVQDDPEQALSEVEHEEPVYEYTEESWLFGTSTTMEVTAEFAANNEDAVKTDRTVKDGTRDLVIKDKDGKEIYAGNYLSGVVKNDLSNLIEQAIAAHSRELSAKVDQQQESEIEFASQIEYATQDDVNYLSWKRVIFEQGYDQKSVPIMTCDEGIGTTIPRAREISFMAENNEMGISAYSETYVSWRFIEEYIINELFMPRMEDNTLAIKFMSMHPIPVVPEEDQEVTEEDVLYESVKIINNPWIRSLDPRVCILPGQEYDASLITRLPGSDPTFEMKNHFYVDTSATEGYLRNILININIVREAAEDSESVNDFAMEILSQVSEACGNPWSFKVITNTALQQVMIIDENHKGNHKGYKEAADQRSNVAYRFSGIGTNNICKDVKIQTKLPSEIQTMAYYAASGAGSSTGADLNMFKLYGAGLRDRMKPNFQANETTAKEKEAKEKNERDNTYKRYWELVKKTRTDTLHGLEKSKAYKQGTKIATNFAKIFILDASDNNPSYGPPIPIDISLTLNGISGIYMGNAIMLDTVDDGGMLPSRYKNIVALQTTAVDQDVSADGWTTNISTLMRPMKTLEAVEVKLREPAMSIPNYVTKVETVDDKENALPVVEEFAQHLTHTGVPYVHGTPQPSQEFYKIRGSQSNGLFATQNDDEEYFAALIFPSWIALTREAKSAGIKLQVNDSWRSFEKQDYLYQGRQDYKARGETPPVFHPADQAGWSKHQSGIGIDVNSYPEDHYKWMVNHAHRFGFRRNVQGEAWHWVYQPNEGIYSKVPKDHESWRGQEAIV